MLELNDLVGYTEMSYPELRCVIGVRKDNVICTVITLMVQHKVSSLITSAV